MNEKIDTLIALVFWSVMLWALWHAEWGFALVYVITAAAIAYATGYLRRR